MSETLILIGIAVAALSGLPGLFARRGSVGAQWATTVIAVLGDALGLGGIVRFWAIGDSRPVAWPWPLPGAEFLVAIDGLSAIFLVPVFLISMLGGIYGLGYWSEGEHPENGRKLRLFYGVLTAGMALLVISRNAVLFLFSWEVMALSAFFLVTTEDEQKEVRETGYLYLAATHTATLCLFGVFALLHAASGTFSLMPLEPGGLTPGTSGAIFVLALVGFGFKAGLMPFHIWLPSAHAITPSHVSAIMSGVILKMGIYGLLRVTSLVPDPPLAWGMALLGLGVASGVLGVAFAIGQHDLKRLLAYHSIENIGIIVIGIGLALIGRSLGRVDWIVLGLGGALLHVWNHALFKALLFFSAGSVVHATRTREIDHLGGLARAMPWSSLSFVVGAVAICGLPPLNGFVSEFLIYLGLFGTLGGGSGRSFAAAAFAAPALAMIGTLAVACFVKAYGAVFLGTARSEHARHAHESPPSMLVPMAVLVVCCASIGLAPLPFAPLLQRGVSAWAPAVTAGGPLLWVLAPLGWLTTMSALEVAVLIIVGVVLRARPGREAASGTTWGCGYAAPTPRMQYTSSSFAEMLVGMFGWVLRPRIRRPSDLPLFPRGAEFRSDVPDAVLDEVVVPTIRTGAWLFSRFRVFQQGNIRMYVLYIFVALIVLLLWR
ncbi:MAG: proton-conducting transporter transmembrane domain-containing protein [Isosphaeraceae bacterium]